MSYYTIFRIVLHFKSISLWTVAQERIKPLLEKGFYGYNLFDLVIDKIGILKTYFLYVM